MGDLSLGVDLARIETVYNVDVFSIFLKNMDVDAGSQGTYDQVRQ